MNLSTSPEFERFKKQLKDLPTDVIKRMYDEYRALYVDEFGGIKYYDKKHIYYFAVETELGKRE